MLTRLLDIARFSWLVLLGINLALLLFRTGDYIGFLETHVSPDGTLTSPAKTLLLIQIAWLVPLFALWNAERILGYFLNFRRLPSPVYKAEIALICTLLAIYVSTVLFPVLRPVYTEDGPLESMTALFALGASCLLLLSTRHMKKFRSRIMLAAGAAALFFLGMEEMSWGQRLIGWETPDAWMEVNHHGETNLHNNIDPILYMIIFVFNFCVAGYFLFARRLKVLFRDPQLEPLFSTHFQYFFVALFMALAVQTLTRDAELMEEIVATLVFSRALSLYLLVRPARESLHRAAGAGRV